ncbi:hypothetical protein C4566_01840 [Candidatus Parcubacteria bacterium]|nr:MAG: hypothetical protein C4566_01840 [Candidatus Parcubacteria bacterium]
MDLPLEQLGRLLTNSSRILLTGSSSPNVDLITTAVAWQLFLTRQKKIVDVAFAGSLPKLKFLPKTAIIKNEVGELGKFKIILDVSKTKVKQLSYDIDDDKLVIDIVPEDGIFKAKDLSTTEGDYKYDLVICLGANSLESLGEIYNGNRNFFHRVSVINIDRSVLNENFGQLNIIESGSSSLAEISYHALEKHIDQDIATCLLAGIIAATNSFQSPQVVPDTLELASELIVKGAKREEIIEALYRTKDIDTLKNWGRILSRLHKQKYIISSHLKHDEADNLPEDFQEMVKDLILSTPNVQVAVIYYQLEFKQTEAWVYTIANINALDLLKDLSAQGDRRFAKVKLDKDLTASRELVSKKIEAKLELINKSL